MPNNGFVVTAAITRNVIAGLDPAIHHFKEMLSRSLMDTRVKPAYDNRKFTGGISVMTPLEKVNSMKMPFAELKGVKFTEAEKDRVVARMLVRPDLCTLHHMIHGGAVMAFADSVGAAATVINLPEDAKGTTTIESKTNFIGGAKEGMTVIATATPVHRGRRTQVWQTRLETEDGKLVAVVTQTQMVL
jgi:uncharacterized protein (TIGR00369 family)